MVWKYQLVLRFFVRNSLMKLSALPYILMFICSLSPCINISKCSVTIDKNGTRPINRIRPFFNNFGVCSKLSLIMLVIFNVFEKSIFERFGFFFIDFPISSTNIEQKLLKRTERFLYKSFKTSEVTY